MSAPAFIHDGDSAIERNMVLSQPMLFNECVGPAGARARAPALAV